MKIAYFCDDVIKTGTAAEEHIRAITIAFSKNGYEVILFTPTGGIDQIDGVSKIIEYHGSNALTRARHAIMALKKNGPFDLIYVRYRGSQWLYLISSTFRKYRRIVEINGIMELEFNISPIKKMVIRAIQRILEGPFLKKSVCIVVTEHMLSYYSKRYSIPHIKYIRNGTFAHEFDKKIIWNGDKNHRGIFIGSIVWWQGLEELIKAVRNIDKFELHIYGDGPDLKKMQILSQELSAHNVQFLGRIKPSHVRTIIKEYDIGFATKSITTEELSPLKLYQYWAAAIPVIATDLSGMELVENIEGGFLYQSGNVDELRSVVINAFKDINRLQKMGNNGRVYVEGEGSWVRAGNETIEFMKSVIQ